MWLHYGTVCLLSIKFYLENRIKSRKWIMVDITWNALKYSKNNTRTLKKGIYSYDSLCYY